MSEPEFHIGQKVFVPWAHAYAQKEIPCPICAGKKSVTLILGSGEHASIECQGCGLGFDGPQGTVKIHAPASGIKEVEITGLSVSDGVFKYSAGYETHEAAEIFLTRDGAEPRRIEKAADAEAQAQRNFESQFKQKRKDHAWSVRYHREAIANLEHSLAWHRRKLEARRSAGQAMESADRTAAINTRADVDAAAECIKILSAQIDRLRASRDQLLAAAKARVAGAQYQCSVLDKIANHFPRRYVASRHIRSGETVMTAPEHSPLPWVLVEEPSGVDGDNFCRSIYADGGGYKALLIARVDQSFSKTDGALIITAVNAHDRLLAAAKEAVDFIKSGWPSASNLEAAIAKTEDSPT